MTPKSSAQRFDRERSKLADSDSSGNSITSRDNKWLKRFRAALRGPGPAAGEPLGLEGPKVVEEAFRSGLEAEALLVSETGERELPRLLQVAAQSDYGIDRSRILRTSDKLFDSAAGTETPQGVAALFQQPVWGLDDALHGAETKRGATPLVVVLVEVQDPGNVGTIIRSAEAFGATGAVATRGAADPWSQKSIRASAGSVLRLPILRGLSVSVLLAQLKLNGLKIVAAIAGRAHPSEPQTQSYEVLREPCALFIGNEGAGLPGEVQHIADARISIPLGETVESLNAGVAASLLLYEAARQRKQAGVTRGTL